MRDGKAEVSLPKGVFLGYTLSMSKIDICTITADDQGWIAELLTENWGSTIVIRRGKSQDAINVLKLVENIYENSGFYSDSE